MNPTISLPRMEFRPILEKPKKNENIEQRKYVE
jgi:hypothetical protein